jgi:hypothetical protein
MPIADLRIRDLTASGKRGVQAFNTKGLELRDMKVDSADGPPFLIRDSADLELDRVETSSASDSVPSIRLDRIAGALIQGARGLLSITPGARVTADLSIRTTESSADFWQGINSPDREARRP